MNKVESNDSKGSSLLVFCNQWRTPRKTTKIWVLYDFVLWTMTIITKMYEDWNMQLQAKSSSIYLWSDNNWFSQYFPSPQYICCSRNKVQNLVGDQGATARLREL